ncbi:alpha/beta hydrolase [Herbidospora sp. RD11066]
MRVNWRFSADGRHAACLALDEGEVFRPEVWDFTGADPLVRPLASACDVTTRIEPLGGERALLCRNDDGRHRISLVSQSTETTVSAGRGPWMHLTGDLVIGDAVHRVTSHGLEKVAALPPGTSGPGVVLAPRLLGLTRPHAPGPVVLDLATGSWELMPGAVTGARILAGGLVGMPTGQSPELRWRGRPVLSGQADPLGGDGSRIALRVERGSRSRLAIFTPSTGEVAEPAIPDGTLGEAAGFDGGLVRVPFNSPGAPGSVLTVSPDGVRLDPPARPVESRVESVAGIEAVTYGKWRDAGRVVVALGGAGRFAYDAVYAAMAAAGIAVVAPGPEALDLEAVRRIARAIGGRPALYGVGHGGHLALLAYATEPARWARCAVVAPDVASELTPLVPRLRPPLMVIHGADDPVVPVARSRRLRELVPAPVDYLEVPGAGNTPLAEAGPALTRRLTGFLAA